MKEAEVKEFVKKRYGEIAESADICCQTCGCGCGSSSTDTALRVGYSEEDLKGVPEAAILGLGCGNPVALAGLREGETVLDLGSGGGIDVFIAANKVGANGRVIGVDMTGAMINKATAAALRHGYGNVEFRLGEIENLPVEDGSVDVVISNCVVNLSTDKEKVFQEAYRVLKPSGRILISDIVTEGELPEEVRKSLEDWAGCLAGALERTEYLDTIRRAGFKSVKVVSETTQNMDFIQESKARISSIQVEAHKS